MMWISHRGLRKNALENSLKAFKNAIDEGFNSLETDLRATKDNHIVLCHDNNLKQLVGKNLLIQNLTKNEILELNLPGDEKLLFFDDFLSQFKNYQLTLDIKPETATKVLEILKSYPLEQKKIKFLTWNSRDDLLQRKYFPDSKSYAHYYENYRFGLGIILGFGKWIRPAREGLTYAIPPKICGRRVLQRDLVKKFRSKGVEVLGYLPRTAEEAQWCLESGVQEILSDIPPI